MLVTHVRKCSVRASQQHAPTTQHSVTTVTCITHNDETITLGCIIECGRLLGSDYITKHFEHCNSSVSADLMMRSS
jgi:hypothetical protein